MFPHPISDKMTLNYECRKLCWHSLFCLETHVYNAIGVSIIIIIIIFIHIIIIVNMIIIIIIIIIITAIIIIILNHRHHRYHNHHHHHYQQQQQNNQNNQHLRHISHSPWGCWPPVSPRPRCLPCSMRPLVVHCRTFSIQAVSRHPGLSPPYTTFDC